MVILDARHAGEILPHFFIILGNHVGLPLQGRVNRYFRS